MHKSSIFILISLAAFVIIGFDAVFTVHQTEQAIVVELGKPVGEVRGPGLHFKYPFIQKVQYFDSRILDYDTKPSEILTKDKKALTLDNYARWRIVDPLLFFQRLRTIPNAQARLNEVVYSELRVALGLYNLTEVISTKRVEIMEQVTKRSSKEVAQYGIEIVDVRVKRTDLPPENQRAVYGRMRAERERQAKQYRSEGQQESTKIKSQADREQTVIVAEAEREAQTIRGEGDAKAAAIYAGALQQAPEFYSFQRSLDAYRKSFRDNTRIILSKDDPFLQYLR